MGLPCRVGAAVAAFLVSIPAANAHAGDGRPSERQAAAGAPTLVASSHVAVVETRSGAVQGFLRHGIYTFRGLPYATAERFMPPTAVPAWQGVRQSLSYGNICPQPVSPQLREPQTFISDTRFWPTSENCQNLNVWTPGIDDGHRRPVMVWLHGGGFFSGSSMELPIYEGTNLSRSGDVVVVSINHRLNALGFLDLSAYGSEYRQSGNVGMLDIVAALQWVRDNIARFGGDPANVTIFGQSGGGAKVATLMAAPSARGLFQRAIIQSGAPGAFGPSAATQSVSRRIAQLTLQNAGLSPAQAGQLRTIPYDRLTAAADQALAAISRELQAGASVIGRPGVSWSPVVDGDFLPARPFDGAAPEASRGIPLLVGSTLSEFQNFPNPRLRDRASWGPEEIQAYLRETRGEQASAIYQAYRRAYPALAPNLLPLVDPMQRSAVLRTARLKAAQGDPVYVYLFAWRSPVLDYAWAAGHSADIAFVFDNGELGEQSNGGGPVVSRLSHQMSQAWINFARTGNPNTPALPRWPAFTASNPATMVFDDRPDLRVNHDGELIRLLAPGN